MRAFTPLTAIMLLIGAVSALAGPAAKFRGSTLIIRDGASTFRLPGVLDSHSFFETIHAVQRRGQNYYVVYGTSEMSRGWPPHDGNCGAGIETSIRWLSIRDGKVIDKQEGLYQSCISNRDGWSVAWKDGKLVWETQGSRRVEQNGATTFHAVSLTWIFDPAHPEKGIKETETDTPKK